MLAETKERICYVIERFRSSYALFSVLPIHEKIIGIVITPIVFIIALIYFNKENR